MVNIDHNDIYFIISFFSFVTIYLFSKLINTFFSSLRYKSVIRKAFVYDDIEPTLKTLQIVSFIFSFSSRQCGNDFPTKGQ